MCCFHQADGAEVALALHGLINQPGEETRIDDEVTKLGVIGRRRLCHHSLIPRPSLRFELGATKEEIAEALGVGISVNAGAAIVYSTRTLDAFDAAT